jgi:histone demethylase JARID1
MLDNFSKEIVYMKMLPPYTQTLFVELIRFTPGQPDGLYSNGHNHRHNGTPSMGRQAVAAPPPHSRHVPHPSMQGSSALNGFASERPMTLASQPAPPPWSRWSTMTVPPVGTPPPGHIPPPPSSRKRKFVDSTPAGIAESSASAAAKRPKPQIPTNPSPRPAQPVSSPSLAKVLAPSESQLSPRPTASTSISTNQLSPLTKPTPSRTSTPVRSVKLVVTKKQDN